MDDALIKAMAVFSSLRSGGNESVVREDYKHGIETKVIVPALEALIALVAWNLMCGGVCITWGQLAWLLDVRMKAGDYLFAVLVFVGLLSVVVRFVAFVAGERNNTLKAAVGGATVLLFVATFAGAIGSTREVWPFWRAVTLFTGTGLVLSCSALCFNLLGDLVDQLGKVSPFERAIIEILRAIFGIKPEETKPEPPRIFPVRRGDERHATSRGPGDENVNVKDLRLLAFVKGAAALGKRGLGRSRWMDREVGGQAITRGVYDALIADCVQLGIAEPGGGGHSTTWAMDPEDAIAMLEEAIEERRRG